MNQSSEGQGHTPLVSIGLPVYNGEKYIRAAIESFLTQTFSDFELIISDNASTDGTDVVCREYAAIDQRIRYVRQSTNLGAAANFKFVFDEARAQYFLWAGCDDTRSANFLEINLKILTENPEYVASTSPNGFDDKKLEDQQLESFALNGSMFERFIQFFDNCWVSHGAFYSVVRTDVLRGCEIIGQSFLAADWAIILYLASKGKIYRTVEGYAILGANGVSRSADRYESFRNNSIELLFPLYRLTRYTNHLISSLTLKQKARILFILLKLNRLTAVGQFRLWLSHKRYRWSKPGNEQN